MSSILFLKGLSGDAHFDDDERFTTGTRDGINLDWVAVHEFGHSLGLGHSGVLESIMYPWYRGYVPDIKLNDDDVKGIQELYGGKCSVDHELERLRNKRFMMTNKYIQK